MKALRMMSGHVSRSRSLLTTQVPACSASENLLALPWGNINRWQLCHSGCTAGTVYSDIQHYRADGFRAQRGVKFAHAWYMHWNRIWSLRHLAQRLTCGLMKRNQLRLAQWACVICMLLDLSGAGLGGSLAVPGSLVGFCRCSSGP